MNKLKIDEPISIFVSKNETLTHKAFLYAKTKSSKPKYYNLKNINTGYFTINTTTTTQTLCTELINFLNCNFDNYDDCFMWFTKFFTSYIIYTGEDDINKFEVNKLYSFNKVKELFKKYFEEIKNDSKRSQKLLSEFVDYIFNINNIEEIKDFTSKIRFYIYYNSHAKKLDRFINNYFSTKMHFSICASAVFRHVKPAYC